MSILSLLSDTSALFMLWLFVTAGIHKLNPTNDRYFADLLSEYGWHNQQFSLSIARIIGVTELAVGLGIIFPLSRMPAAIAASALLLAYTALMAVQLYQGRQDLDCGCAGPGRQLKISGYLLLRNILLAGFALFCVFPGYQLPSDSWLLALALTATAILLYVCCEQLISNNQQLKTLRAS